MRMRDKDKLSRVGIPDLYGAIKGAGRSDLLIVRRPGNGSYRSLYDHGTYKEIG